MPFVADAWLSETMSRPVFRWSGTGRSKEIATAMADLASGRESFFFCRLPTLDVALARTLIDAGFSIVDTTMTFELGDFAPVTLPPNIEVGLVRPDQVDAVASIAERSFRYSRFHLDPNIPVALANHVKRRWIENYGHGRHGSGLYVASVDRTPVGFLAVIESKRDSGSFATIDLIGVAPEHQGAKAGAALVGQFVTDWQDRASGLRVGTQGANIRSIRFYERLGFRAVETSYVLHAHFRNGAVVSSNSSD